MPGGQFAQLAPSSTIDVGGDGNFPLGCPMVLRYFENLRGWPMLAAQACEAHDHAHATQKQRGHSFLKMVGRKFGAARLPRRMFVSPGILLAFRKGCSRDIRPKVQ
jgi:hypothetical protein